MAVKVASSDTKKAEESVRNMEKLCDAFGFRIELSRDARGALIDGIAYLVASQVREKIPDRFQYIDAGALFISHWHSLCEEQGWRVEMVREAAWVMNGVLIDIVARTGIGASDGVPLMIARLNERFGLFVMGRRRRGAPVDPSVN